MRIVILSASFFPAPTGATYSAFRLAKSLRERRFEISFVVGGHVPGWANGGVYEGFPVRSFSLWQPGKWRKILGLCAFTRFIWSQRRVCELFHINGGGYVNLFLGWWVRIVTGLKVSLKITSDGWDTPDVVAQGRWGYCLPFFYRGLDGVVAMTRGQTEKCRQWGVTGHIATIPNGVDISEFRPVSKAEKRRMRDELGLPSDAIILVYLGWLGYGKGTDILFRIWGKLVEQFDELILLTVGDYTDGMNMEGELPNFVRAYGLEASVLDARRFRRVGHVTNAAKYLQVSDIFVFPSRREGFGTVQIEAMACGLPCVVNDLPGLTIDIIPDESVGFRVQDNDVEEYVRVISDLIRSPEKRQGVGRAARQRVQDRFTREIVAAEYAEYMRVLARGPLGKGVAD